MLSFVSSRSLLDRQQFFFFWMLTMVPSLWSMVVIVACWCSTSAAEPSVVG